MHSTSGRRPPASTARLFEIVRNDPDFRLRMFLSALADTANPYYAWQALDVCLKHKKEIPDWLAAYLEQCIERMRSDRARQVSDLRKILPWIFDFPMRAGPGKLLDPDHDPDDKLVFAIRFAVKLEQGEKLSTAMMSACEEVLGQERAEKIDRKTLKDWLVKVFGLKEWPARPTEDDLKRIAREHFGAVRTLIEEHLRRNRK
jgi:hypothetical protein